MAASLLSDTLPSLLVAAGWPRRTRCRCMGTSLFSLVRVRRFTVIARSFSFSFWEVLPGLETRLGIRKGSPESDTSPGASWKVRLQLRRVVRTPCHPKPDNRSHEILHSNGSPVNEIMLWSVGYSRQRRRGVRAMALRTIYWRYRVQAPAWTTVFCWQSGRMVLDSAHEKISTPNQSISPVFSITYLHKMPQFAA